MGRAGGLVAGYGEAMSDLDREAPTLEALTARLAELDPEQAARIRVEPAPLAPEPSNAAAPPPVYASFSDFLAKTTPGQRLAWCRTKAKKANGERLMSPAPEHRITAADVATILMTARGRCAHCGSLAVERRPSNPANGAPLPWEHVGRRIGSLGHVVARFHGGTNTPDNLAWSCLWCNTWQSERIPGATDRGGYHPEGD
ncbi:MAG: hypothetical protein DLM62_01115 [Pseudonocardiales bacterium]|nr:MAG: hypothetical protein DLM62_01115 [Pseudonocardiales bacterium]